MEQNRIYNNIENRFDRFVYQNDKFFWFLVLLYLFFVMADWAKWVPEASGYSSSFVVTLFAMSWVYTNARRRGLGFLGALLWGIITYNPPIGGLLFMIFRPKNIVVINLPPAKIGFFPVSMACEAFMFFRVPFRFLVKLVFWAMGVTFLIIGILSMLGKI